MQLNPHCWYDTRVARNINAAPKIKGKKRSHFTCKALTMPSIISGSRRGSSPCMLTTISYFFSSFWSASLQRSVPTSVCNYIYKGEQYPIKYKKFALRNKNKILTVSARYWGHYYISTKAMAAFCNLFVVRSHNYAKKNLQMKVILRHVDMKGDIKNKYVKTSSVVNMEKLSLMFLIVLQSGEESTSTSLKLSNPSF